MKRKEREDENMKEEDQNEGDEEEENKEEDDDEEQKPEEEEEEEEKDKDEEDKDEDQEQEEEVDIDEEDKDEDDDEDEEEEDKEPGVKARRGQRLPPRESSLEVSPVRFGSALEFHGDVTPSITFEGFHSHCSMSWKYVRCSLFLCHSRLPFGLSPFTGLHWGPLIPGKHIVRRSLKRSHSSLLFVKALCEWMCFFDMFTSAYPQ
eukprot:2091833-Amphidinium_carterae.4